MKKIVSLLALGSSLAISAPPMIAHAQAPAPAPAPAVAAATVALPGDNMGTGMRMGPPPVQVALAAPLVALPAVALAVLRPVAPA